MLAGTPEVITYPPYLITYPITSMWTRVSFARVVAT